jgi:protein-S-isoprenylcysteine O-methyltransferase Ste14
MSVLVREEIELAKAEVTVKAISLAKGAAAVAAGAVFGVFAVIFGLMALAWGINDAIGNTLWIGFIAVFGVLALMGIGALLFAMRKLKVGAPAPTMAIDEAKRIRATVTTSTGDATVTAPDAAVAARTEATR